jgi:hypothetical protein
VYDLDKELVEHLPSLDIENLAFEIELKRLDDVNYIAEFYKLSGDKTEFFSVYDEFLSHVEAKN